MQSSRSPGPSRSGGAGSPPAATLALAFAAGIAASDAWLLRPTPCWLGGLLLLAALPLARLLRSGRGLPAAARTPLLVGAALLAGAAALGFELEEAARIPPGRALEGVIGARVKAVEPRRGGRRLLLDEVGSRDGALPPLPRKIELFAEDGWGGGGGALARLVGGERVRLRVRLRAPRGRSNPGSPERELALARRGIGGRGAPVHPALAVVELGDADARPGSAGGALARLRSRVARELHAAGPGGSLLASLALGDRSGIDPPTRDALRRLGLAHLLALSGLHVGLVAGLAFAVAARGLRRCPGLAARTDTRRAALWAGLAAASAYAGLAGLGPPLERALVLLACLVLAVVRRRPTGRLAPLALAAGLVLVREPAALFDVGAQLSFAASAGILAARHPVLPAAGWRRHCGE